MWRSFFVAISILRAAMPKLRETDWFFLIFVGCFCDAWFRMDVFFNAMR